MAAQRWEEKRCVCEALIQHTSKTLMEKKSVHPNSRHAFQRQRIALRERRLTDAKVVRNRQRSAKGKSLALTIVDRIMTFILLLDDDKTHLPDLNAFHDFINTFYLTRHDAELEMLRAEQRPGRPKNKRLVELEDMLTRDTREYHEGMDVPDLCNETNVAILREWKGDPQGQHLFRFVRISSADRYV